MNINKLNLEVSKCASTEESRYHLNGVHFTSDYTEATNGHILARVTYPTQFPEDELPEMIKSKDKSEIKEFVIPLNGVKEIKFPKGKVPLPILADTYVDVEHTNQNGVARFSYTDLQTTPTTEVRKIDGDFADTEAVWCKDEPQFEFTLNPNYLKRMCDIAEGFGGRVPCIKLTFYKKDGPMKIDAYNQDPGQYFKGLVMPMRGNGDLEARDLSKTNDPFVYLTDNADLKKIFVNAQTPKMRWKLINRCKRVIKRLNGKVD